MSSPTRLRDIVSQNESLRQLLRKANAHQNLSAHVLEQLDTPLRDHVCVGALHEDVLVLVADSPAWAARLRYVGEDLRARLASLAALPAIKTIRIRVARDDTALPEVPITGARRLSNTAATGVKQHANCIPDEALRAALLRIAANEGQKSD